MEGLRAHQGQLQDSAEAAREHLAALDQRLAGVEQRSAERDRTAEETRSTLEGLRAHQARLREMVEHPAGPDEQFPAEIEIPPTDYIAQIATSDPSLLQDRDGVGGFERYYVAFEKIFYETDAVSAQQSAYLDYLQDIDRRREFLDLGCGRGEFLEILAEAGVPCVGIDINPINCEIVASKGLKAVQGDALALLRKSRKKFGGISLLQVIEHLDYAYMRQLFELAHKRLAPRGKLLIETLNPLTPVALNSFYMDETHVRPLPPEMVAFLLQWTGFDVKNIVYSAPLPPQQRVRDKRANYYNHAVVAVRNPDKKD